MFYVTAIVTTKLIFMVYTQKEMRREFKHVTTKKSTQRKVIRRERRNKKSMRQTENNEQNGNSKF